MFCLDFGVSTGLESIWIWINHDDSLELKVKTLLAFEGHHKVLFSANFNLSHPKSLRLALLLNLLAEDINSRYINQIREMETCWVFPMKRFLKYVREERTSSRFIGICERKNGELGKS